MGTDEEWEDWAQRDPYFGVWTRDSFRRENLTEQAKAEFFATGQAHVDAVLRSIRQHIDPTFTPTRVLDFGCGTGRLLIPFARVMPEVVGLDVAPTMLDEARRNCDAAGLSNVTLARSDDALSMLNGDFDLIHSYVVFQHVPSERALELIRALLQRLREGGVAVLHVVYGKKRYAHAFGAVPQRSVLLSPLLSPLRKARRRVRRALGVQVDPEMQMNTLSINDLLFVLQAAGAHSLHVELTDHGGELGALVYFRKQASQPRPAWP